MNIWSEFQKLIPSEPITYGAVLSSSGNTCRVELPGGSIVVVDGSATVGANVWMRRGRIIGEAPAMNYYAVDV